MGVGELETQMIVKLQGGLGNQMFQYAYGRSRGAKFDRTNCGEGRSYALDPFNLPIELDSPADTFGYWQSEKFFDHDVAREQFLLPPQLRQASLENTVAVHIRMADNFSDRALAFHGNLLDTDYYGRAIRYMKQQLKDPKFVLYSDGSRLQPAAPHHDIWSMARCPYIIIANSSFSWWGAWLGPQKIVIAPKRWFVVDVPGAEDIVPDRWIKM